jgi:transaldolase
MNACLEGLEERVARGGPAATIYSVASFVVSRVDSKVDKAIEAAAAALAGSDPRRAELLGLRGRAAIANAKLAYAEFREVFGGARFAALRARGAHLQRPLWASTSTKNPAYPDTLYVDELIGADTVNTMPPQTLAAFNDHGTVAVTIDRDLEGARAVFRRLPALGVPVEALIDELEAEGVQAFVRSYDALLETLESRRQALAARSR